MNSNSCSIYIQIISVVKLLCYFQYLTCNFILVIIKFSHAIHFRKKYWVSLPRVSFCVQTFEMTCAECESNNLHNPKCRQDNIALLFEAWLTRNIYHVYLSCTTLSPPHTSFCYIHHTLLCFCYRWANKRLV